MKAVLNMLADTRVSPQEFAHRLMQEHPSSQEAFIVLFVTYLVNMSKRSIYHEEVGHIVKWSKDVMIALDKEVPDEIV